jgi:hypothetical protein
MIPLPPEATHFNPTTLGKIFSNDENAWTRAILKGAALRDGSRIFLKATRLPAGWRIEREDLELFLSGLTAGWQADSKANAPAPRASAQRKAEAARIERMHRACQEAGI